MLIRCELNKIYFFHKFQRHVFFYFILALPRLFTLGENVAVLYALFNISSVVQFQRLWELKSKLFGQESTCHQGKMFEKFLRVMTVCQKLGVILESKVVQKLSLEKKVFNK